MSEQDDREAVLREAAEREDECEAMEHERAMRLALERGRARRAGRLALLEILSWLDQCLLLAWDPTPDVASPSPESTSESRKIEVRLMVEVAKDQSIESVIADARSVLIDALGEFRSARGGDLFFPTLGIESYVARRYEGQTPKFRAQKVAEVARRCATAQAIQSAVFGRCKISEKT